jgi:SAM-dependent methyltransferase
MRETFECPACGANDWESVAEDLLERPNQGAASSTSEYLALRQRVLFEVWLPGADEARLTTVMCRRCGFMTYRPRPSSEDIDAKYRFLQREERHIGSHRDDPRLFQRDMVRARRVFETISAYTSLGPGAEPLDVLDFGGGDGKMLIPFRDAGHRCALVDYNVSPLEGITKVGDTLDDLPVESCFDVIISSHVLEHLADPAGHVASFQSRLRPGGVVYGEVPSGIWRGIGIARDPVTHINFFTRYAFGRLFERAGLSIASLEQRVGYYSGRLDVIATVARNDASAAPPLVNDGVAEARALLQPTLSMDIARRIRLRRLPRVRGLLRRITRS